ncbi:MAG: twin-arginine translocase subunit TatC [Planctomycetota bacterium]
MTIDTRMPLRQHLDELRRTLLRMFVLFLVLFFAGIYMSSPLLDFVTVPWDEMRAALAVDELHDPGPLIYIGPSEGMIFSLRVAFLAACIVGAPFFLWELWRFIGVGLLPNERAAVRRAFVPAVALLLAGMVFGFRFLLPLGLQFLVTYLPSEKAIPQVTISMYLSFVTTMTLVMGMVFETPLVMWAVVRGGLITTATLRRSRKIAILGMLLFAAIATPPDPFTLLFVAAPMILLYEVGLVVAKRAEDALNASDRGRL